MNYQVDRTEQLEEAHKKGRFAQKASLQAAGVPTRQHNVKVKRTKKQAAKKTTTKKSAAKQTTAKKSAAKKTAKKS